MTRLSVKQRKVNAVRPGANFLILLFLFSAMGICLGNDWFSGPGAAFVFAFTGWVLSLCLHEFGHAWVAWKGGDDRIPETGYLTLDPLRYVDPMMSIVMPMIFTMLGGLGFPGGAVLIDRRKIRNRIWQSAISAAGPAMNGLCLAILIFLYNYTQEQSFSLRSALAAAAYLQCTAIILNLMPIPGIDGYGIIDPWLPDGIRNPCRDIAAHSGLIVTALFVLSNFFSMAIGKAGFGLATSLGFAPTAIRAGFAALRLW